MALSCCLAGSARVVAGHQMEWAKYERTITVEDMYKMGIPISIATGAPVDRMPKGYPPILQSYGLMWETDFKLEIIYTRLNGYFAI